MFHFSSELEKGVQEMRTLRSLIVVALLLAISAAVFAHTEDDPFVAQLIAGNPKDVLHDAGDVGVWNDGDNLYVSYVLNFGPWQLTEMHLEVVNDVKYDADGNIIPPTKKQVPQANGNPIPGRFTYSNGPDFTVPLEWDPETELYVVAHGKICTDVQSIIDALNSLGIVTLDVNASPDPDVYIEAIISGDGFLNGIYDAYCINAEKKISASYDYYTMRVSTNDMPNMDLVNYVINRDYIGQPCYYTGPEGTGLPSPGDYLGDYTNSDIQGAIWKLFSGLQSVGTIQPPPNPLRVDEIVADAEANGQNFVPDCGEYLAVKLLPEPSNQGGIVGVQGILIKFPLKCCQTVWGGIVNDSLEPPYAYQFPGSNWALYFTYKVQVPPTAPPRMGLDSGVTTTWGSIKNR